MENIIWNIQAKKSVDRSRQISCGNSARTRMGQNRYNNMDEDRKRHVRLEWKC